MLAVKKNLAIYNEIYERVLVQMDKYEFNIKVEQIKKLMKKKDYITAVKIADTIDWEKVKQKQLLIMAADVYEIAGKYDDARDVLLLAYERTGLGRQLAYRLCRLSVKRGDFAEAEEFYEEFVHNSPLDAGKYILSYEISKGRGESVEKQILMLESYIEEDMDDRWAYELAKLYHRARFRDKCVEMCDTIVLWFAEGKYVEKAMELKQVYAPLSESQRIKYEAQKSRKAEELELVRNEEEETEQQLQVSAMSEKVKKEPKSKRELKLESEPKYEPKSEIRSQSRLKPESVLVSEPEPEPVVVEKKNGDILDEVNEVDIDVNSIHVRDYSVNNKYDTVNLQKELARSVSSLFDNTIDIFKPNVKKETEENEDKFVDDQIEGQMNLEDVLAMFESGELRVKDDSKETKEQVSEVAEDVAEDVIEEKVETIEELEIEAEPIEEVKNAIEAIDEIEEQQQQSIADIEEIVNEIEVVEEKPIEENLIEENLIEEDLIEEDLIEAKLIEVEEKNTEAEAEKQKEEKAIEVAEKEAIIAMLSDNNTKKKSRKNRKASKDKRVADIIDGEIAAMQAFEDEQSAEYDDYEDEDEDEKAKIAEDSSDNDVNKLDKERNVQMFDLKQENEDEKVENPKPEEEIENPKLEEKMESPKSEEKLESLKPEEKATKTPSESAKEELKNFIARFAGVQGLDKQILKVMQNTLKIDKSSVKFIFVKGEVKSGKTTLAIEVLKLANKLMQRRDQRIAKIKAENINGKSVSGLLKKLDGSDVLIERVSDMDVDTFVEFIDKIKEENRERIVIFEDEKSLADAFLEKVPQNYATFGNILDIRQNKIKDWTKIAENYANSKGYALDEMGTLALSAKIDQLRAITLVVHKDHIEQLVDGAIKNRNRLSLSRLFGRGGGKNEEGLKLLTERDFSL